MLLLGIISYGTQEFHPNYYSFGRNFTGNGLIMVETEGKKKSSRQDLSNTVCKHSRRPEYSSRVRLGQPFLLH